MPAETFSIDDVTWTGSQFEATIPEIGVKVTGATRDELLENAGRAIMAAQIKAAEERKRKNQGRTVA
jgi:hypothetical protein